ncbi:MAG: helix-hairpin-helix domain-containing protein [Desulfuromonadales bacterium]|nr:helix-hairpin-helix domain-containing protein [Desulfuromonadales bacterium]
MQFHNKLLEIAGIDEACADRLIAKGVDTFEKLADAKSEKLIEVTGLPKKAIDKIHQQARKKIAGVEHEVEESLVELTEDAKCLKVEVEQLVLNIRERFSDNDIPKEQLRELRKETARTLASLERVEAALSSQLRRLGKGLTRADREISEVAGLGVDEVVSGLKKARKKIDKTFD